MKQYEADRHKNMSNQLGMPRGTASNRLRKLVLFDVLKRHHENLCYRCGKEIESVEDLSIEHKRPWENVDAKLFWDLSNIAFSHLRCNIAAARHNPTCIRRRIAMPNGKSWCAKHKQFLFIDRFSKDPNRPNGLGRNCKDCVKVIRDFIRYNKLPNAEVVEAADCKPALS